MSNEVDYSDPEVQRTTTTEITAIAQKYRSVRQVTYSQDSRGITLAYLELLGIAPPDADITALQQEFLERFPSSQLQVMLAPMLAQMTDERTVKQIAEGLRTMLWLDRVATGDIGNALRELTVAVEKLDQRITELWPGA